MIIQNNNNPQTRNLGNKMCVTKTKEDYDELVSHLLAKKEHIVIQATFSGIASDGREYVRHHDTRLHSFSYDKKIMKVYSSTFTEWQGSITIYWHQPKETSTSKETKDYPIREWSELDDIMPLLKHGVSTKEIAAALDIPEEMVLMVIGYHANEGRKAK